MAKEVKFVRISYDSYVDKKLQELYDRGWSVVSHTAVVYGMGGQFTFVLEREKERSY